jgi:hypothetical protein
VNVEFMIAMPCQEVAASQYRSWYVPVLDSDVLLEQLS